MLDDRLLELKRDMVKEGPRSITGFYGEKFVKSE